MHLENTIANFVMNVVGVEEHKTAIAKEIPAVMISDANKK